MTLFYDIVLFSVRVYLVLCVLYLVCAVGAILYDRYVSGNVDAFKPQRRVGPADRRAGVPGH